MKLRSADDFAALYQARREAMVRLAFLLTGGDPAAADRVHEAFVQVHARWSRVEVPEAYLRVAVVKACRSGGAATPAASADLRDVVSGLPWRNRAAVVLRYHEDVPMEEVAVVLGCSPDTARSLVSSLSSPELEPQLRTELAEWAQEAPLGVARDFPPPPDRRHGRVPVLAVAAALVVVVVVLALLVRAQEPQEAEFVEQPPPAGRVIVPLGDGTGVRSVAVGPDGAWVVSSRDSEVYRVDPERDRLAETFDVPDHMEGISSGEGYLWLSGYDPDQVVRLDPTSGDVEVVGEFGGQPNVLAAFGALWVLAAGTEGAEMTVVDPVTLDILDTHRLGGAPGFLTAGDDELWFSRLAESQVARFDPSSGRVDGEVSLRGNDRARAIVVDEDGAPWVTVTGSDQLPGHVVRIDPVTLQVSDRVQVGRAPHALAVDRDTLWVTNRLDGTLSAIDLATRELRWTTPIGATPGGVATGFGSVWVSPHRQRLLVRLDPDTPQPDSPTPDLARVVETDGLEYYLRCSGRGTPTVVLEADPRERAGSWAFVEAALAGRARVCTADLAGFDDGDPGRIPDAQYRAEQLRQVLAAAGEDEGPLLLVGDGLGAHAAHRYAHSFPDGVEGLVLVNPPPDVAGGLGDLPLVVIALESRPDLRDAQARQVDLSSEGRLVIAPAGITVAPMGVPSLVVDAIVSLLAD